MAPSVLSPGLAADLARAKVDGAQRVAIEAAMPAGLRYVKGWPVRLPTLEEADAIAAARLPILARHGLDNLYPTGAAVMDRFAQLMAAKERKAA